MWKRSPFIPLILLIILVAFTACQPVPRLQGNVDILVKIKDSAFQPTRWRVPGGATITLTLKNEDTISHRWVLLRDPLTPPFDADDTAATLFQVQVYPGETKTVQFLAPLAPGKYDVAGDPDKLEEGMLGILLVVQP
jgi:plastocyanin